MRTFDLFLLIANMIAWVMVVFWDDDPPLGRYLTATK